VVEGGTRLANEITRQFGLVGLNGIDLIVRNEVPYLIEVNPRWCSSMELVERCYGLSMFGVHATACVDGTLPDFDLARARRVQAAIGKAIVFARQEFSVGDTQCWLGDRTIRDVPKPGEPMAAGQPICTVLADGHGREQCLAQLRKRAASIVDLCLRSEFLVRRRDEIETNS
jgi:predicted ATP-grasp superfamily ATP-dependent carboligase